MSTKLRLPSGLQAVSVATLRSSPTADYVIFVSPWWNPAADDPASGRAHRIGQQRPVTVYWLVTQGSIEDRIVKLHRSKRALAEGVLACWRAGVLACWRAGVLAGQDGGGGTVLGSAQMLALLRGRMPTPTSPRPLERWPHRSPRACGA